MMNYRGKEEVEWSLAAKRRGAPLTGRRRSAVTDLRAGKKDSLLVVLNFEWNVQLHLCNTIKNVELKPKRKAIRSH